MKLFNSHEKPKNLNAEKTKRTLHLTQVKNERPAFAKTSAWISILFLLFTSCSNERKTSPVGQNDTNAVSANASPSTNVPRPLQFPRDEAAHYEQPIEWWYLNSQFSDAFGKKYAFFFCVFSTGRHFVSLFDKTEDKVYTKDYYESVSADQNVFSVNSLSAKWKGTGPFSSSLVYDFEGLTVQVALKSNKKPFFPGETGFVPMGLNGTSFYYALTDLTLTGTLAIGSQKAEISGKAWMDHQWGKWDWVKDFSQWKWYSVKLDNGVDLMLFNIYKDGKLLSSECGYIDAENNQHHKLACRLVTREYYTDESGGKWQKVVDLEISSLPNTKVTLTSERDSQFIEPQVLWEGSMKAEGLFKGVPVKGTAYGELNRPDR